MVRNLARPVQVGLVLTVPVLVLIVLAGLQPITVGGVTASRARHLLNAPAAQLGDTLSGIGSVLAFVWVVVTVWMQSLELQAQRRDIAAQSAATRKMAKALEDQSGIYNQEQRERAEDRADKELDALVDRFVNAAGYMRDWRSDGVLFADLESMSDHDDRKFDAICDALVVRGDAIRVGLAKGLHPPRRDPDDARQAARYLAAIAEIAPRLSPASQIWLTKFDVAGARRELDLLLAEPRLWEAP